MAVSLSLGYLTIHVECLMFTWHDNITMKKFLLLIFIHTCMCVCAVYLYVKIFMMCQMKISHNSIERTPLSVLEIVMRTKHSRIYIRTCVCLCVVFIIITNTILSIKINSTKGNRADASAFFFHLPSVEFMWHNPYTTEKMKKTISVAKCVYYRICRAFTWCIITKCTIHPTPYESVNHVHFISYNWYGG